MSLSRETAAQSAVLGVHAPAQPDCPCGHDGADDHSDDAANRGARRNQNDLAHSATVAMTCPNCTSKEG